MLVPTIRPAHPDDAEALAHLAERTFRETFTTNNNLTDMDLYCAANFGTQIQRQEILDPNRATIFAEIEHRLVAFAQVRLHSPKACVSADHPAELQRLYVTQVWQGKGVAHQVMAQSLHVASQTGADAIWLGVAAQNTRAIAFYRKYKFRVVGEHIFQLGLDLQRDLVMRATLQASLLA